LAKFEGANVGGINTYNVITKKVLEVGIPRGASASQIQQINKAILLAEKQGIKMNVRVVK